MKKANYIKPEILVISGEQESFMAGTQQPIITDDSTGAYEPALTKDRNAFDNDYYSQWDDMKPFTSADLWKD